MPCKVIPGGPIRGRNTGRFFLTMEFRTIPGYGGLYEATDDGRIYGLKCRRPLNHESKMDMKPLLCAKMGKNDIFVFIG